MHFFLLSIKSLNKKDIMEKALIVFDNLVVDYVEINIDKSLLLYKKKQYYIDQQNDYYIGLFMEKENRIYRFFLLEEPQKIMDQCVSFDSFKGYDKNTIYSKLKEAEKALDKRWEQEFENLLAGSSLYLDDINTIGKELNHIEKLIQRKKDRERVMRNKEKKNLRQLGENAEIERIFIVEENLLINIGLIKEKVSDKEYIVIYGGKEYSLIKSNNGIWTLPHLPQSHEVYIHSHDDICYEIGDSIIDIDVYDLNTSLDILYEVLDELFEIWLSRFNYLQNCRFSFIHIDEINTVSKRIEKIRNIIKSKEKFALIVFSDYSVYEIHLERKEDNGDYTVLFDKKEFAMKGKMEEDYWTIPALGYNEIYIRETKTYSFLSTDIWSIPIIMNNSSLYDLYCIESLLKELWTERFEFMIQCDYDPIHLIKINECAEKLINVKKIIKDRE